MKMLLLGLVFLSPQVFASNLFTVTKNHNPKNVLHFDAEVRNCKFASGAISNFWKMGEEEGQKEDLSKKEEEYFEPKVVSSDQKEINFSLEAMDKMDSDIEGPIKVKLEDCVPHAYVTVEGEDVKLSEINVELGFLMKVKKMELIGMNQRQHKPVKIDLKG
jgi:hypothetical protein